MGLEDAVNYYHSLERFGIRPGLESIRALCGKLGNPQTQFPCVHVAGTNGKGSTCTEIASVLTQAGYRTGLYTSPYLLEFRERIRLDGEMIGEEDLIAVTDTVRAAVESLSEEGICVTEFEAVTAAAFLYYAGHHCDVVVLETGLGGRFDATNIIKEPLCSIITSVSLDHTGILGDTLEQIAFEKCGIIKEGRPVVTSSRQPQPVLDTIRSAASARSSRLVIADPSSLRPVGSDICGTTVKHGEIEITIPFPGAHQLENTSLVISAIEILKQIGYHITDADLARGISLARIPARIEVISRSPLVILDGSHNDGSTSALADTLKTYLPGKKILAVMGMMADKDCRKALDNLLPFFAGVIAVTPSNPRSMPADEFCRLAAASGVPCEAMGRPEEGVRYAFSQISAYDALVVCGSLYLAADVRPILIDLKNQYSGGRYHANQG